MSETILSVDQIGKRFKVYRNPLLRLIELFSGGRFKRHTEKWVLNDISFRVTRGEAVAIVGRNGSGKSTLLSIVVGSRSPTSGSVDVSGRVSALLELGMGFDPEFTGRQNAVMGLQLLGVPDGDIEELVVWIESFCELGEYFDHPLRTYSSGMQVRLGFSVATAVEPDVLIVDEALAVGDAYFQHKSMARIRQLQHKGTTLLFVSHDAASVKALCDRAILLDQGRMLMDDTPIKVMDFYNAKIAERQQSMGIQQDAGQTRSGSGLVKFVGVELVNGEGAASDSFKVNELALFKCHVEISEEMELPTIGFSIRDRFGGEVFGTNTFHLGQARRKVNAGTIEVEFEFTMSLGVGSYSMTVAAHTLDTHLEENYDWWDQALVFEILSGDEAVFHGTTFLAVKSACRLNVVHSS